MKYRTEKILQNIYEGTCVVFLAIVICLISMMKTSTDFIVTMSLFILCQVFWWGRKWLWREK